MYNTPLTHYGLFTTPNMSIPTIIIVNQQQYNKNTFQKLKVYNLVVNWQKLSGITTIFMHALLDYAGPYSYE